MSEPTNPWDGAPRKRRDTQFAQKREAVLKVAAKLFREKGYERASLNDLADILQITKPTVYYYVHSKEQLLLDILRAAQHEILTSFRAADASQATGYEKLRRIMIDYALVMISDHGACMASIPFRAFEEPAARTEVAERIQEADRLIYRILERGKRDGTLKFGNRAVALHALFGSLNWMAYWAKAEGYLKPQRLAETQVDLLLEGVRTERAAIKPEALAPDPSRRATARKRVAETPSPDQPAPARPRARLKRIA